jgi:hypothetical protein
MQAILTGLIVFGVLLMAAGFLLGRKRNPRIAATDSDDNYDSGGSGGEMRALALATTAGATDSYASEPAQDTGAASCSTDSGSSSGGSDWGGSDGGSCDSGGGGDGGGGGSD